MYRCRECDYVKDQDKSICHEYPYDDRYLMCEECHLEHEERQDKIKVDFGKFLKLQEHIEKSENVIPMPIKDEEED